MNRPLVSIGVPTYNRADYLRISLDAIRKQDYPNLEIILSDNGSEDETERACREAAAADPRVRYVKHPRNIGLYQNLNFCLDQARGEFLCTFHDDDLVEPTIVSEYVAFLQSHPEVGIVCSDWDLIDEDGRTIGLRDHALPAVTDGLDFIDRTIRSGRSSVGCPGMMVRASALGKTRFVEDGPLGFADFVVWFEVAERSSVGHVPRRLWHYRHHVRQLSWRTIHASIGDYGAHILAYCDNHLRRWPGHAAQVERWREAVPRYLFWLLVYELALGLRTSNSNPDSTADATRHRTVFEIANYRLSPEDRGTVFALLRQYARGPSYSALIVALQVLVWLRLTWPLAWASRHTRAFRSLLRLQ